MLKEELTGHNPEVGQCKEGKHYDAIIEDDIPTTPEDARKTAEWYKMAKEMERLKPTPIFTNVTEGGDEMDKYLYHVILFNTETEKIDFKEYVPAKDAQDAGMLAAQEFGKYDSDVHITIIKMIENSGYTKYVRLP